MTVGPLEPHFRGQGVKKIYNMLICYIGGNEALELRFPNLKTFLESVEPLSRNRHPNMTQNEPVYAICCRPVVAGDVISGENVKTVERYTLLNFEVASFGSF